MTDQIDRFENLKQACGGRLNPETLAKFQIAMREYEIFMREMRLMFFGPEPDKEDEYISFPP